MFLLTLSSCLSEIKTEEKVFTIKKNNHYSNIAQVFIKKPSEYSAKVKFDSSAMYQFGTETDWNKLLGVAYVEGLNNPVHNESARWVWRWNQGFLQLSPYCYVDGKIVKNKIVITRNINTYIDLSIKIDYSKKEYKFYVDGVLIYTQVFIHDKNRAYILFPYFGGNHVAPHDIRIIFRDMVVN